jgi:hypothetical protein
MRRLSHNSVPFAALLVALFWACGAGADIIGDSDTTGLIQTDFDVTLSVDQFDASLGTLTQVTVTVSGQLQGGGGFENFNDYAVDDSYHYTLDQALDVTWVSGTLLEVDQNLDNTIPVNVPAFDGTIDFAGTSGYTESAYTQSDNQVYVYTLPGDLAAFIGAGTVDFDAIGDGNASQWAPGGVIAMNFSLGEATIEVEYLYTPIPEPATLLLVGFGAAGLLLGRRKS